MRSKLTKKDIESIMRLIEEGKTQSEIAKIYGVSQGVISRNLKYYKYELEAERIRNSKCSN